MQKRKNKLSKLIMKTQAEIRYLEYEGRFAKNIDQAVVDDIRVCHLHSSTTKWGSMSIADYVNKHLKNNCERCGDTLQKVAINLADEMLHSKAALRRQVSVADYYYRKKSQMPTHHAHIHVKSACPVHCEACNSDHTLVIKMFGSLLNKQNDPVWYKGGIVINGKFQYMKWRYS